MATKVRPQGMGQTTIGVSERLADELYARKGRGESYEDVIWRLIEVADAADDPALNNEVRDRRAEPSAPRRDTGTTGDPAVTPLQLLDAGDLDDVVPGSGAKLQERRTAVAAAVEYLREEGTATPTEFKRDVYPDEPARYVDGDDPAHSWWNNCVYKGLRALAERTDEIGKADTTGRWTWEGERE